MIIRNEQMDVFQEDLNKKFARRISPTIRSKYPDETSELTDEELVEYLDRTTTRAQSYGLTTDNELLTFIRLTLTISEDFDGKGVFRATLRDKTVADNKRMDELFLRAGDEDWLAAMNDDND